MTSLNCHVLWNRFFMLTIFFCFFLNVPFNVSFPRFCLTSRQLSYSVSFFSFFFEWWGTQLASFRPSSHINYKWMQTPAREYGLQEACDKLSPLGRTFNLLSWGTAAFQVAQLKDMHLPGFYSPAARQFKRRESIWSKWPYTDSRCRLFCTNVCYVWSSGPVVCTIALIW